MTDLNEFLAVVSAARNEADSPVFGYFSNAPVTVARAPGRLDVMGGIADYSGSLVLEMPTREATFVAAQPTGTGGGLRVVSLDADGREPPRFFTLPRTGLDRLLAGSYDAARQALRADAQSAWAAYVAGVLVVLARELGARCGRGLNVLVWSRVPEAKGVSSSAALEVAVMTAIGQVLGSHPHDPAKPGSIELARLCQLAENYVVGAPCGIMDQVTSAYGEEGRLLALLCQPADVRGNLLVPASVEFWGIDSGIRHAVSGSDYTSVRTGAFMGYRILAGLAGLRETGRSTEGVLAFDDPKWGGYLANLSPETFMRDFSERVPLSMRGDEFLARYGGTTDPVTRVEPDRTYAVRRPTAHPVFENDRVRRFAEILGAGEPGESELNELGMLMYGSHQSYSDCGLGSTGTDRLVELVREAGPSSGLHGAKITGGGSGGTVAVLGRAGAAAEVEKVARRYGEETGHPVYVFSGSSPGACAFGVREV